MSSFTLPDGLRTAAPPPAQLIEAYVSRTPATVDAPLWAALEGGREVGPCPWPARGATLPAAGDRVLVARSDEGAWWCVAWWPYPLEEV